MSKSNLAAAALAGALLTAAASSAAVAQQQQQAPDVKPLITPQFVQEIRAFLDVPVIRMSIQAQNERRAGLNQAGIDALDAEWRAQRKADDQPLIAATLSSPASSYLTQVQANAGGLYAALFVMDAHGLNVGQSAVTSDYWQGDEDKFTRTFPVGPDAVFVDAPEFDDEMQVWIVQVNLTLADNGKAIGTATVEVNAYELARRAGVSY